ncbi:MAG: hypothetical protein MJ114_01945 [Acetatifactor sp.]|nr:hypothetical protein [Acetatifactor sp.]
MNWNNKKAGIRELIPAVHFLLSFLYERLVIQFTPKVDIVAAIAKSQIISEGTERVLAYVISKIIGGILILLLWKLIFYVIDHIKISKDVRVLLSVFAIGLIMILCIWPEPAFDLDFDNYITFSYAIRLEPEYWHSAYTSYVYCGCMMVIPHPVAIAVVQWVAFVASLGYLMVRMEKSPVLKGKGKWLAFLLFLVPGSFTVMTSAYRTELYAVLCIFAMTLFAMDAIDHKERTAKEIIGIAILCAFLAVWRSEGLILGFLSFFILILFVYRPAFKKVLLYFCSLILAFLLILMPQKLGDMKYYGNDYSFINSFTILMNIFNTPGSDLSYEGVEQDLAAIEAVAPIELIKAHGMEGYRRYNVANGRKDINQSLADQETGKQYKKAFYRLILHNPKIYIKTQTYMLFNIFGLVPYYHIVLSDKVPEHDLPMWTYDAWDLGEADLNSFAGVAAWRENSFHQQAYQLVIGAVKGVRAFLHKVHIDTLIFLGMFAVMGVTILREFVLFCRKKKCRFAIAFFCITLFGQIAAIWMVMPASSAIYLHPSFYACAVLVLLSLCELRCDTKQ